MTAEDIRNLFDYNAWANHRSLEAAAALTPEQFTRDLGSSFKSVRDTLAHIAAAEWIWFERFHGLSIRDAVRPRFARLRRACRALGRA